MRADGGAGRVSARRGLIKANLEGVNSWCPLFRDTFCMEKCGRERESCPLSGIRKRPLLGGCECITSKVISIRIMGSVRCREVVRFSEGPLWEVRLYYNSYISSYNKPLKWHPSEEQCINESENSEALC